MNTQPNVMKVGEPKVKTYTSVLVVTSDRELLVWQDVRLANKLFVSKLSQKTGYLSEKSWICGKMLPFWKIHFYVYYPGVDRKFVFLTNFRLKIMLFFIWPEISFGWIVYECLEPKYGNAKQHFNFPFSWVKPGNSSYFARYFREFTSETWLGTP